MFMGKRSAFAAVLLASASLLLAADAPTTQPTAKLIKPYSLLKDLTPEQSVQIEKIHKGYLEEQHKLEIKQKDDIAAVLTPAQATELIALEDKAKAEAKLKMAEKKKAATEPAG
jgi:hypothetical protein